MTAAAQHPPSRRAFVTGVSGGIGGAIAQLLLTRGWAVWGTARAETGWAACQLQSGFHGVVLDLTDREGTLKKFTDCWHEAGGFDVIINNAGYGVFAPFTTLSAAELDQQLAAMVTTTSALIGVQMAALRGLETGILLNVSSLAVEFPLPFMAGYNMAKAALSALSESLMMECAGTGIVVIDFRPGDIKTGFNQVMAARAAVAMARTPDPRVSAAWHTLEAHLDAAPSAASAALAMWRAIQRRRSGVVRSGGVFQARIAPVLVRLIPERLARIIRWRYFGLTTRG